MTEFVASLGDVVTFIRDNSEFFAILTELVLAAAAAFIILNTSLLSFVATFLGASVAFLASPLFLIPAALVAITVGLDLLLDDFRAWQAGASSHFGAFWDNAEKLIDRGIENWKAFGKVVTDIIDNIVAIWDDFIARLTSGIDKVANIASGFTGLFDFGSLPVAVGAGGGTVSNRSTTNQIGNVSVTVNAPGADSKEIAANVGQTLTEQMRATAQDFDSSIKR